MNEWHPIETAPKDGTRVLFGFQGDLFVFTGYIENIASNGHYIIRNDGGTDEFFATHWMPLPKPPK